MTLIKKFFIYLSSLIIVLGAILLCVPNKNLTAFANEQSELYEIDANDFADVEPRLLETLSIALYGGDGKVWVTVKNDFTLFPSTVYVIVQLYSSSTYTESYEDMELVAVNSTLDLDMGHTITATASTNGKQMYWMGRLRYKVGSGDWKKEVLSGPGLFSASGEFLGLTE